MGSIREVAALAACGLAATAQGQISYAVEFLPGLTPTDPGHVSVVTQTGVGAGSAWDGNETRPVRWVNGTPVPMTVGPQQAVFYWVNGHSGDTLVGHMRINDHDYAFRWDPGSGLQPIMTVPGSGEDSYAYGINSSGAVAGSMNLRAVHWTASGGATVIQFPNTPAVPDYGGASAINDAGVVVGYAGHAAGPIPVDGLQAFRWTAAGGIERLDIFLGGSYVIANDINAAGDIVGIAGTVDFPQLGPDKAWLWSNGTLTVLGDLTSEVSDQAVAINDAGEILGYDGSPGGIGVPDLDHWVWIKGQKIFLDQVTSGIPAGWQIEQATDINSDGTIAAILFNDQTFERSAALLVRDSCYPDCNASGNLTIADFGCFQAAFSTGNMYADCNGSGTLTIADFGCFQGAFAAGCP